MRLWRLLLLQWRYAIGVAGAPCMSERRKASGLPLACIVIEARVWCPQCLGRLVVRVCLGRMKILRQVLHGTDYDLMKVELRAQTQRWQVFCGARILILLLYSVRPVSVHERSHNLWLFEFFSHVVPCKLFMFISLLAWYSIQQKSSTSRRNVIK